jgi:hypothetical protein
VLYTVEKALLQVSAHGGLVSISWNPWFNGLYRLQQAGSVEGPWTTVEGATNPHVVVPIGSQKFFRLINP